ncbi:alpha/beta hydrolase [Desulfosarcina widdelii]|uniref:Alpha/beta hydrolase n=1 Tax=Desulfosarcina widdelii TaxID=947919 RepID=A0A5K7Z1T3_9BACT|nr:alpha/beta hydrolase [Desulfosarcina widdelii]BBO75932.1 alpha/beta hydrolase [Desulfosarcina widdelii]
MDSFKRQGYQIAYEVHGSGKPTILLHGVTASFAGNYAEWGWIQRLNAVGCQVIGMDFRGHGKSDKPRDPAAYGTGNLSADVLALLDHLGHQKASIIGYALGSVIGLNLLHKAPARIGPSVLIATGDGLLGDAPFSIAEVFGRLENALERGDFPADLPPHESMYWTLSVKVGGDRLAALAAVQANYPACSLEDARSIQSPVLVVSGETDPILGRGPRLAESIPNGSYIEVPGADHFALSMHEDAFTAVGMFFRLQEEGA